MLRWRPSLYVLLAIAVSSALWVVAAVSVVSPEDIEAVAAPQEEPVRHYAAAVTTDDFRTETHFLLDSRTGIGGIVVLEGPYPSPAPAFTTAMAGPMAILQLNEDAETQVCITVTDIEGPIDNMLGTLQCFIYDREADTMTDPDDRSLVLQRHEGCHGCDDKPTAVPGGLRLS